VHHAKELPLLVLVLQLQVLGQLVRDHHGLERRRQVLQPLALQANHVNRRHEYLHQQEFRRDKLFSASSACSLR
jgi:hypothetical protein